MTKSISYPDLTLSYSDKVRSMAMGDLGTRLNENNTEETIQMSFTFKWINEMTSGKR